MEAQNKPPGQMPGVDSPNPTAGALPAPSGRPGPSGPPVPAGLPVPGTPPTTAPRQRRGMSPLLFPALLLIVLAGAYIGYRFWYNETYFVSTDNARIAGTLIQVGALNAGRVERLAVDVGSQVDQDQMLATVIMPSVASISQGSTKMGYQATDDVRVEVRSPIRGEVLARNVSAGDTVAAGQPLFTVVNPDEFWVSANIEETKVGRLRRGQTVEVKVDALDLTFPGRVDTIVPATTATFSLLPQQNGSGNFTKITQLLPVKILVNSNGHTLPLGGSVSVRIKIREPQWTMPAWLP
jgi:multidrug resistance efflux pump